MDLYRELIVPGTSLLAQCAIQPNGPSYRVYLARDGYHRHEELAYFTVTVGEQGLENAVVEYLRAHLDILPPGTTLADPA
jgi:hypothetical protein